MDLISKQQSGVLTSDQLLLLNKTICKDLNRDEMQFFAQVCQSKGLDPFSNQIYAIKRGGRLTFQTGIDGFRSLAERTGEYEGQEDPIWFDEEGKEHRVWLSKKLPVACMVGVYRKGFKAPIRAIVHLNEYMSSTNPLWKTMPIHLLYKTAEAAALRKTFPLVMSNLYEKDETLEEVKEVQASNINSALKDLKDVEIKIDSPKTKTAFARLIDEFERLTENKSVDEKRTFLKESLDFESFNDIKALPDTAIEKLIEVLRNK